MEHLPFDGLVADLVHDARTAVEHELAAAGGSSRKVPLAAGRLVGSAGEEQVWSFAVDEDVAPEPETPAVLEVPGGSPVPARVLAVGDTSVVLAVTADLGDEVRSASLSMDLAVVYLALLERLADLAGVVEDEDGLVHQMLLPDVYDAGEDEDGEGVPDGRSDPDEDQRRAAGRAVEPGVRFTWGPPGTGKTRVLAMAVAEAARRGDRVLVLAHANAAVDVAMERIADELADDPLLTGGRVLRAGTPHVQTLLARHEVLPEAVAATRRPDLQDRLPELAARRRRLSDELRDARADEREALTRDLDATRTEIMALRREVAGVAADLVDEAAVVGTTLARAVLDARLWEREVDVVVVDEASMAPLPFVLALALRGAATLSVFGDFRQLPPICVADSEAAQRWFARDVFEFAGVVEAHDLGHGDPRLSVLRTQFRMGEQVCGTVNRLAYDGILLTDPTARNRAVRIAEAAPAVGTEVVVVDTSSLAPVCVTDAEQGSWSRANPLAAAVAVSVAESLVAEGCSTVGIISPYRAQTRLASAWTATAGPVDAATIHRFQGSERDAVVFDLTDGPAQAGPSRLTGPDSTRLLTVAASRARGKLVVVADMAFVDRTYPRRSPFRRLVDDMVASGAEVLDALDVLATDLVAPAPGPASGLRWRGDWAGAAEDLVAAAGGGAPVDICLPDDALVGPWLDELVVAAGDLTVRCTPTTAARLEGTAASIRLLVGGPAPWCVVVGSLAAFGGSDVDGPVVLVDGRRAVSAFRRTIAPDPGEPHGVPGT